MNLGSHRVVKKRKTYKSQSLETGNKRALTPTTANRSGRIQPANSQYRTRLFFTSLALLFGFGHQYDVQTIRIPCSNHLMATRVGGSAMPDSNFNIQLADINAHTTHSERTEVEKKKQQLKARNTMADGACRSQTARIPHRKYRCLN